MGFEDACARIQESYLAGRKDEAAAAVPLSMVEQVALVGPRGKIAEELDAWRSSLLTTMVVGGGRAELETVAELVG